MLKDAMLSKSRTLKIAKDSTDNPVTELIYWVRINLEDKQVNAFTNGNFESVVLLSDALKQTIQDLGIWDEKGLSANFSFFISGEKKNKIYLAGIIPLTDEQKALIEKRFGVSVIEVGDNLYHLEWR